VRKRARTSLLSLAFLVLAQSALAEDFAACTAPETKDDQRITACTNALSLAFANRGIAYFNGNDLDQALADFNHALDYNSNLARALDYRSKLYWRRFLDLKAVDDITAAIRVENDPDLFIDRAKYALALGDWDFAIRDATQAISLDKQIAEAYAVRGTANARKKDFSRAIADFDEALKLNPTLTRILSARQRAQDAIETPTTLDDYVKVLIGRLESQKRYPREAIRDRQEGRVMVDLVIARNGALASMTVRQSSGYPVLDDEVKQMISEAQPFPALWDVTREKQQFTLPVRFRIADALNDVGK